MSDDEKVAAAVDPVLARLEEIAAELTPEDDPYEFRRLLEAEAG